MGGRPVKPFEWNTRRWKVAYALAEGKTAKQAARAGNYSVDTIHKWKQGCPDFMKVVNELTLTTGLATKAERARLLMRGIEQSVIEEIGIKTERDVLDWIKELRLTIEGEQLDIKSGGEPIVFRVIHDDE